MFPLDPYTKSPLALSFGTAGVVRLHLGVEYDLLHPSQDGTGSLSRPLAFDLVLEPYSTCAIFVTADIIASNNFELSADDFVELNFF